MVWDKDQKNYNGLIAWQVTSKLCSESVSQIAWEMQQKQTNTKNDIARWLHLRDWPAANMLWTAIVNSMDRNVLDSRKSSGAPSLGGRKSMASESNVLTMHYLRYSMIINEYIFSSTCKIMRLLYGLGLL